MSRQQSLPFLKSAAADNEDWTENLPSSWRDWCQTEFSKLYFQKLAEFVRSERETSVVFPPTADVFNALRYTPFDEVKVVIIGQDPYHDDGQAHGLCFSVRPGVKPPPSLVNIFKELKADLDISIPTHGCLTDWARQGVLLLNTVLTVRAHQANSHRKQGWEEFTDEVIRRINDHCNHIVFVLWGRPAEKKLDLIDETKHSVIQSPHPSPLSAHRGFFGNRPFSRINQSLIDHNQEPIDWELVDVNPQQIQ